jgi:hypothetical protein
MVVIPWSRDLWKKLGEGQRGGLDTMITGRSNVTCNYVISVCSFQWTENQQCRKLASFCINKLSRCQSSSPCIWLVFVNAAKAANYHLFFFFNSPFEKSLLFWKQKALLALVGAYAKFQKAATLISFGMPLGPSAHPHEQLRFYCRIFIKFGIWESFENLSRKFKIH